MNAGLLRRSDHVFWNVCATDSPCGGYRRVSVRIWDSLGRFLFGVQTVAKEGTVRQQPPIGSAVVQCLRIDCVRVCFEGTPFEVTAHTHISNLLVLLTMFRNLLVLFKKLGIRVLVGKPSFHSAATLKVSTLQSPAWSEGGLQNSDFHNRETTKMRVLLLVSL